MPYTRHTQFTYRLIFVKCRFKGDASETSFRPCVKWPFLASRTGRISSYSCPVELVSSRIDSSKCPLQDRGLGSHKVFDTTPPPLFFWGGMTLFVLDWPQKRPKNGPKSFAFSASFCLILLSTSQNITKKSQNDRNNGPKMAQKWS